MSQAQQEVYIAGSGNSIKIGRSVDPEMRVKDLSVGNPEQIKLLHTISVDDIEYSAAELEKLLHRRCDRWRQTGEWFDKDAYHFIAGLVIGIGTEKNLLDNTSKGNDETE